MPHSQFSDENILYPERVLITILKKNSHYYLIAEGMTTNKHFAKILTQYKDYFLPLSDKTLEKYKSLSAEGSFYIPTHQFNAITKQKLVLDKELAYCLKCSLTQN